MSEFSQEDLIKRLLTSMIGNYQRMIAVATTIGNWTEFNYIIRHVLDHSIHSSQIDDIRDTVRAGAITDQDIIDLLIEVDRFEAEANKLIFPQDQSWLMKSRQGAITLLRRLIGEMPPEPFWYRIRRKLGLGV